MFPHALTMHRRGHGEESLRAHRISASGASYFVTLCTRERMNGLHGQAVAEALTSEQNAMARDGHWSPRCTVIMPDHLHLFFRLGDHLPIQRCIGRFKTKTRFALAAANLRWQSNFFEHRLRPDEAVEPVLRYLFLNPYRKQLVPPETRYPWFWICPEDAAWFFTERDCHRPIPDWIQR